jgi:uncharacterized protein involved in tolerance to divalent cations
VQNGKFRNGLPGPGRSVEDCFMQPGRRFAMILVTVPDRKIARALVRGALRARLIACGNLVPGIESHYWWRGKITRGAEILLILKTTRGRLAALEKWLIAHHPYDTPEILDLALAGGTKRYLAWIAESVPA